METFPRRNHFELFRKWDHPHFNICANLDVTAFYPYLKEHGIHFTVAVVYLIARTANAIPEFRYRIRGDGVVEHEVVHPSATILADDDLFTFCTFVYQEDFSAFAADALERIAQVKEHPTLEDKSGEDHFLFMTSIPWVSFTSFTHPMNLSPADSVPRFAWGKIFEEGDRLKMPFSVQGHHAVMDGLHMGRYYEKIQGYLDQPESVLNKT
jgi:chloramphenicol O-acetyltransferase type A